MRPLTLLPDRSPPATLLKDLLRLGIPMSKVTNIIEAADKASHELCAKLGSDAASCALAIALGKLCAETGLNLSDVLAMAEVTHREVNAELSRGASAA